jgi:hypothetical protein
MSMPVELWLDGFWLRVRSWGLKFEGFLGLPFCCEVVFIVGSWGGIGVVVLSVARAARADFWFCGGRVGGLSSS